MTDLYPIGTQLITWRISQASSYVELFGDENIETLKGRIDGEEQWLSWFDPDKNEWRVTVTEENQKWLSPVPMEGDLVTQVGYRITTHRLWTTDEIGYISGQHFVEKRTFPSGQRAPLIEWDEVILPGDSND